MASLPHDPVRPGTGKGHRRGRLVWSVLAALSICCAGLWAAFHARLAASHTQVNALEMKLKSLENELRKLKAERRQESHDLANARKRMSSLQSEALRYETEASKQREEVTALSKLREQAAEAHHTEAEEHGACESRMEAADATMTNLRTSLDQRNKAHYNLNSKLESVMHALHRSEERVAALNQTLTIQRGSEPTNGGPGAVERLETLAVKLMHGKSQHSGKKSVWGNIKPVSPAKPDPYGAPACASPIGAKPAMDKVLAAKSWVYSTERTVTDDSIGYAHMAVISALPAAAPWGWIMIWQAAQQIEGAEDQTFMATYSLDATRWTEPVRMSNLHEQGCLWSPVLHRTGSMVWLFYSESVSCKRPANKPRGIPPRWAPGGSIKYVQSEDGVVWSRPTTIWEQLKDGGVPKVIANQIVVTRRETGSASPGLWVLPYWQEVPQLNGVTPGCPAEGKDSAGVLLSRNQGRSWVRSKSVPAEPDDGSVLLLEGAAAELSNGTLLQVFRTHTGALYSSTSLDGVIWRRAEPSGLPNPNSKANLLRLEVPEGNRPLLALAYNHNDTAGNRNNLWVALSDDDGAHWHKVVELEGVSDDGVMMHYPTLAQSGCRLMVTYSVFYRMLPKCLPSNPVCPKEAPQGQTGIRLAEIDLAQVEISKFNLIPAREIPSYGAAYR